MAINDPAHSTTSVGLAEPPKSTSASAVPHTPWTAHLPRPVRTVAHWWWKLFAAIVISNYVPGLVLALVQGGVKGLLAQITSWGLLAPVERADPPLFWTSTGLLALLAVAGFFEERAEQEATHTEHAEVKRKAEEALDHDKALVVRVQRLEDERSNVGATSAPAGLPFDDGLLPAPPRFVGRESDVAWVLERLSGNGRHRISALVGLGGIGKTALAAEALRRLHEEGLCKDGIAVVICVSLADPAEVLRRVVARFDLQRKLPRERVQEEPEDVYFAALVSTATKLLEGKDALVVLDNVEPLLPAAKIVAPLRAAGVAVLLTARQTLPVDAVPPEGSRTLDLLPLNEATDLFAAYFVRAPGLDLTPDERVAAETIVTDLGRHTLAVKLAAAYAREQQRPLDALARELADPQRALALLPEGDAPQAVRTSFAKSYDALPHGAQSLFASLASFSTSEFGRLATLALGQGLGQSELEARGHLELLVRRSLLDAGVNEGLSSDTDRERLQLHPLLRALAEELLGKSSLVEQVTAAMAVAQYFAGYAEVHKSDTAALSVDGSNLVGALEWAHSHDQPLLVAELAHGMRTFWLERGRYREGSLYLARGLAAADVERPALEEPRRRQQRAELELAYGQMLVRSGQPEAGAANVQHALNIFRDEGDRRSEGAALSALGQAGLYTGQYEEATSYLEQSLAIRREVGDRQGEGVDLGQLGQVAKYRRQLAAAASYLEQSLAIRREVGDRQGEGVDLSQLGQVAMYRGEYEEATSYLEQSLAIRREVGDRQGEGVDLGKRGEVAMYRGQLAAAASYLEQSLAIRREVGDRQGEGVDLGQLGQVALYRGHYDEAASYLEQSLVICREIGDRRREASSLCSLGRVTEAQDDPARAETLYRQSLELATERELGAEIAEAQLALGQLLTEHLNRSEEGCLLLLEAAWRYSEMGMPEAHKARLAVERNGCKGAAS